MNYYRKYPGDYAGDTSHLSCTEHGAYSQLLDYCYAKDTIEIPKLESRLFQICGATKRHEKYAVRSVVAEFFPGGINERVRRQLPEELERLETAREKAKKGGEARWGRLEQSSSNASSNASSIPSGNAKGNALPIPTPTPLPPTPTPTPTKAKYVLAHRANGARQADTYSPAFEACWAGRPRRSGADSKLAASRAWRARLQEGVTEEAMAAGMCRYRSWCEANGKIGTEFTMQAERFFGPRHHFDEEWKDGPASESFKEKEDKRKAAEWERQKEEFLKKGAIDGEVVSDE